MTVSAPEIELKYDADDGFVLPDLSVLPGIARVDPVQELELAATYFDTADFRLAQHRITLRRRSGGYDAGWHLKLPTRDGDREEVGLPLGRAKRTVPAPLAGLVRVHTRDGQLTPIAQLSTTRRVHRLIGPDEVAVAEVAEDAVTAETLGSSASTQTWEEIEVELLDGNRELLDQVGQLLEQAGARPSSSSSKLARALGDRATSADADLADGLSPASPAADVVRAHLKEQVDQLVEYDPRVRRDEYDSVHKMRVATRRLRSALRTYRPLFDRSVTDPIRDELKWLATVLGEARDAEVMHERLTEVVAAEPSDLVLGPVARRIDVDLNHSYREAHDQVLATLDSDRYFKLLDALDLLVSTPPLSEAAAGSARKVLPKRVGWAWRQVKRLADAVEAAETAEERDHNLHEVRKAAKRARYAGESVAPAFGSDATEFAKRMEDVQEVLGEHQDSVVTRALLRRMGVQAHLDGDNAFTFGRLHALEQARGDRTQQEYGPVWEAARDKKLRRWLR